MKRIIYKLAGILTMAACSASIAATFPDKTVTVVVPFPPGGTTDTLARNLAQSLSEKWDQTVVVENRGGASGTIGSAYVARSKPDGYTLLVTATHHVINPSIQKEIIPYETKDAFTSLAMLATVPNVLVINNEFEVENVQDLIKLAREKPGEINFGSAGIGGANHLSGELLAHMADIKLTHIPYRGAAPSLTDLLGNQIPMMFDSVPGVIGHIQAGNLKALGVTSLERVPQLPEVPTIAEQGVEGFEAIAMFGLYGPKDLSPEVIEKISSSVNDVLKSPELQSQFEALGAIPGNMSQPEFASYVNSEIDKWSELVEAAGIEISN